MEQEPKLLPCPFCGSTPAMANWSYGVAAWRVSCGPCHFTIAHKTESEAIAAWNRRPSAPAGDLREAKAQAVIEAAKDVLAVRGKDFERSPLPAYMERPFSVLAELLRDYDAALANLKPRAENRDRVKPESGPLEGRNSRPKVLTETDQSVGQSFAAEKEPSTEAVCYKCGKCQDAKRCGMDHVKKNNDDKWCGCSNSWDAALCECQCHEGASVCDKQHRPLVRRPGGK